MQPARKPDVRYHVPHRIREGYGMQSSVLGAAAEGGVRVVISVDTGIRAVAEAQEARRLGLDLIVTDHHLPDGMRELPDCLAVINPAQPGCPYPDKNLCGAAVAFKLAQALLMAAAAEMPDPMRWREAVFGKLLPSFLKLVAIATIADSVPLRGENRVIAALGLAALANPVQPGLRALMEVSSIPPDRAPTAGEVGFRIGPRINAAGRMDVASDVVDLFLTRDPNRARDLAAKLDRLNQERRDSEAQALDEIERELATMLDEDGSYPPDCLILDRPDWHRGVLGILASRVVERTGRPTLVVTHADGHAHGSGRSVAGFHLLDALTTTHEAGDQKLFARFGGHAHAVGFSLPSERLAALRERMSAYTASVLTPDILAPEIRYDAEIGFDELNLDFFGWVQRCAPFGVGNPEPVFLTRDLMVRTPVRVMKDRHICLQLGDSVKNEPETISALGWSRAATDWLQECERLRIGAGSVVDVLYRIRRNTGRYAGPYFDGIELELFGLRAAESLRP
jgi:single-stranded-DNA-specific exonuclease